MSSPWLQNMLGSELTEEQMKEVPHPKIEVAIHVTVKAMQAFGFLGLCVIGPLMGVFSSTSPGVLAQALSSGHYGVTLGMTLGPIIAYLRLMNQPEDKVLDRCYRLRRNQVQLRVDRASFIGMGVGSVLGLLMGSMCNGFVVGMVGGVIAGVVSCIQNPPKKKSK